MKKIVLILLGLLLLTYNSYADNIQEIIPVNTNSIDVKISDNVSLKDGEVENFSIKVLKDLIVSSAYRDTNNNKKIILNLTYDLKEKNTYSLLAISGVKGDVDFSVDEIPSEISLDTEYIEKITVLDNKNLEILYKNDLEGSNFVYKILEDLGVKSVFINSGILNISVDLPLETFSSYILLINSLFDSNGKTISFDENFYDFNTPDYLKESDEKLSSEENQDSQEIKTISDEDKGNVEEVAMNSAKKTPSTGTATSILILFTAIFSGFYFLKSKK